MVSMGKALSDLYDPDARAMTIVALGSAFVLMLFIANPDRSNPVYLAGLLTTGLVLVVAVGILVSLRER